MIGQKPYACLAELPAEGDDCRGQRLQTGDNASAQSATTVPLLRGTYC